jgi:hypothetical protein
VAGTYEFECLMDREFRRSVDMFAYFGVNVGRRMILGAANNRYKALQGPVRYSKASNQFNLISPYLLKSD